MGTTERLTKRQGPSMLGNCSGLLKEVAFGRVLTGHQWTGIPRGRIGKSWCYEAELPPAYSCHLCTLLHGCHMKPNTPRALGSVLMRAPGLGLCPGHSMTTEWAVSSQIPALTLSPSMKEPSSPCHRHG